MFVVKHRHDGTVIDEFETYAEASECVDKLIETDKANDEYEPNVYVIEEN